MPVSGSHPSFTRRRLLVAAATGAGASAVPGMARVDAASAHAHVGRASSLPLVTPIWSQKVYEAFGVCAHPSFLTTGYQYTNEWMAALAETGASYFRGMYSESSSATARTTALARQHGVGWGMLVYPEDWTMTDQALIARIRHIAANAADVCRFIEGVNEPNHERGGGPPPSDWVARTVDKQRLIWQTVRSDPRLAHVKVIGPSLHAVAATEAHYQALGEAGIARYMDYAGLHRYPGGRYPNHLLDERLRWVALHWSGRPTWITETGYTNALATPRGHRPVPESVSAVYGPSAVLEAADRGCNVAWFELLDDPDAAEKDVIESNFGMYATTTGMGPIWRPKPIVAAMASFLPWLEDPGPTFTPASVRLKVTSNFSDVRTTVVGKRSGGVVLYVRRATDCWDPDTQQPIAVEKAQVKIETPQGLRTFAIDHVVRKVRLRF